MSIASENWKRTVLLPRLERAREAAAIANARRVEELAERARLKRERLAAVVEDVRAMLGRAPVPVPEKPRKPPTTNQAKKLRQLAKPGARERDNARRRRQQKKRLRLEAYLGAVTRYTVMSNGTEAAE